MSFAKPLAIDRPSIPKPSNQKRAKYLQATNSDLKMIEKVNTITSPSKNTEK
jgi:hypothetical protein